MRNALSVPLAALGGAALLRRHAGGTIAFKLPSAIQNALRLVHTGGNRSVGGVPAPVLVGADENRGGRGLGQQR